VIDFTDRQKEAIRTTGSSVVVSAAAGSGKTAVLAERCAHLVCDLPAGQRCRVDELLVVTFTEAAAAEMKARILAAIRRRAAERPDDDHTHTQAALIDTAQVSTIHAFCLWMLRRWFNEASIDPAATVLDADAATLLRSDTLNTLFDELYGAEDALGTGFRRLVDDYGLGNDRGMADVVLRIAAFLESLPDPEQWLEDARSALTDGVEQTLAAADERLRLEIRQQTDQVAATAALIRDHLPAGAFHARRLREYLERLEAWARVDDIDTLRAQVAAFDFSFRGSQGLGKGAPPEAADQRDTARRLAEDVRDKLFKRRLKKLARFSRQEMRDHLARVAPYVDTIVELVRRFRTRYARAKRAQDVLDFSDQERGAFELLHDPNDPAGRSAIARELNDRFAHLLVDEFQDINPLQAEILRLASREGDADRPDNFFCVGDVKQSIYRFRLAEPDLFRTRIRQAETGVQGSCVHLTDNFRTVARLLDGINLLFERLMSPSLGGVDYDRSARLNAGRTPQEDPPTDPIEVHILERRPGAATHDDAEHHENGDGEDRLADSADPAQWEAIEREAYVIGSRLLELRAAGLEADARPLAWGDVAVLVRAAAHTAAPLAEFLGRLGIPAQAQTGGGVFDTTEVRDVLALLGVLDNLQQDIPLAAVLRSGVTGLFFSEDDLVAIRLLDRGIPFHETVRRYADRGPDGDLRERLTRLLGRLRRWRAGARRRPLADLLWSVYLESGYLAYVGGLVRGQARRANLLALHERARQFGVFQRQGLRRFLHFLEGLQAHGQEPEAATPPAQTRDAVQVISIHRSKGLEFPVVFLADLGRTFNLTDARKRIIFDRTSGIGLRAVDPQRLIEYPTVVHSAVARSIEAAARDEEMRVLYVALTRARQRLILVGSAPLDSVQQRRELWSRLPQAAGPLELASAGTALDWLIAALATADPERVIWDAYPRRQAAGAPAVRVILHADTEMADWHLESFDPHAENPAASAAARLEPLPAEEPRAGDDTAAAVLRRLDRSYPHLAVSSVRAVVGASEAKNPVDPFVEEYRPDPAPARLPPDRAAFPAPAVLSGQQTAPSPRQRGIVVHRFLEQCDFAAPPDAELRRVVDAGVLSPEEARLVDTAAVAWFTGTDLGRRIRDAGESYKREFIFISAEPAGLFDPTVDAAAEDTVLVRGMADGVLPTPEGLEVVDFKTDAVQAAALDRRAEEYGMQVRLYARAVARVWRRPVTRCWLVFLGPRRIVERPQEQSST